MDNEIKILKIPKMFLKKYTSLHADFKEKRFLYLKEKINFIININLFKNMDF